MNSESSNNYDHSNWIYINILPIIISLKIVIFPIPHPNAISSHKTQFQSTIQFWSPLEWVALITSLNLSASVSRSDKMGGTIRAGRKSIIARCYWARGAARCALTRRVSDNQPRNCAKPLWWINNSRNPRPPRASLCIWHLHPAVSTLSM